MPEKIRNASDIWHFNVRLKICARGLLSREILAEGLQEKIRRTNGWSKRDVRVSRITRIRKSFGDLKRKMWWLIRSFKPLPVSC